MALVIPSTHALASWTTEGPAGTAPYVTTCGVLLGLGAVDLVEAANTALTAYGLAFDNLLADGYAVTKCSLYVDNVNGRGSVDSDLDPIPGTRSGNMAPVAMALIARKVTSTIGRTGRGRMFIPAVLADGDVDPGGSIESVSVGAFQSALDSFSAAMAGDGEDPALPLQLLHDEASPQTLPSAITALQVGPTVGWIRGRIR